MKICWCRLKLSLPLCLGIFWGLFLARPAFAEEIGIEHLRIQLDTKNSRPAPKGKKERAKYFSAWKKACGQLGKALTIETGPWATGVFGTTACYRGDKRVSGPEKSSKWLLTVVDGAKEVSFTITHQDSSGNTVVAETKFPASTATLGFFDDDEFTDLVSFSLMESMPMAMAVTKSHVKGEPPTFTGRYWRAGKSKDFKFTVPEAPKDLVLYKLSWDEKGHAWRSQVVGTAKQSKIVEPKKKKKKKGSVLVGGEITYETTPAVAEALTAGPLWAHSADGPAAHQPEIAKDVNEAQTELAAAAESGQLNDFVKGKIGSVLSSLLDSAASGYVGLRYGLEVLPGEGAQGQLINKTSFFGLLLEIRGGPVKGLRYYYDKMPETKATVGTTDQKVQGSIAYARHTLGFSWDFNPGLLVDRITVDPKLGMWTFNSNLPVTTPEGNVVVADFNLGHTASLALEIGAEELSDWYTIREWYGISTGYSIIKTGGKVTSNRFGVDAYFTAGPTFPIFGLPVKTALMAFYFYETVDLSSGETKAPAVGETVIKDISLTAGYAGGGIGLSW